MADGLGKGGVDGLFYWYDNNWHYIRRWDHIKTLASPATLPVKLLDHVPGIAQTPLPRSDAIMARTLSIQIKLSWTQEALQQRIEAIRGVFTR